MLDMTVGPCYTLTMMTTPTTHTEATMTSTKIIHTVECARVFNRYDLRCPRCQELAAGQPARQGWSRPVSRETWTPCPHRNDNPGGYCNTCGNGRDFS